MSVLTTVLADSYGWNHMNGWGGGSMWLWGLLMMVLFVVLIGWLVRASDGISRPRHNSPRDPTSRAQQILADRYARGELTSEEYRERINELQ